MTTAMIKLRESAMSILLLLMWAVAATAGTQTPPTSSNETIQTAQGNPTSAPKPAPAVTPTATTQQATTDAALERIKQSLEGLPTVRFDTEPLYYASAYSKGVTFEDLVGSFDLRNGPVPYAGMTHKEFLDMVRPKDLISTTGITPLDMLQAGLVNYAMQRIIRQGYVDIKNAKNEAEVQAIRDRINRELKALAGESKKD